MKFRSLVILAGFCISSALIFAQQPSGQAPTLADIARQKRAEKATKVFTSDDLKPAPPPPAPVQEESEGPTTSKPAAPQSNEALAAAKAKVDDLRDREILLNKNIARFETSLSTANAEGNEERAKSFQESLDTAHASLEQTTQQRIAAEKELDEMQAAAAAAAATKKKPKKGATTPQS